MIDLYKKNSGFLIKHTIIARLCLTAKLSKNILNECLKVLPFQIISAKFLFLLIGLTKLFFQDRYE